MDGQTDVKKLTVAFRNVTTANENVTCRIFYFYYYYYYYYYYYHHYYYYYYYYYYY